MNRRKFIKASTVATASLGSAPLLWGNSHRWKGANDRVNVAVIGIRGQGQSHIEEYSKLKNVEVTAICDVDTNLFAPRIKNCSRTRTCGNQRPFRTFAAFSKTKTSTLFQL